MNRYSLIFLIVVTFNYFISVYAENDYYVCAIIRKNKDDYYDEASEKVQTKIDELVNERMNDIYTIIKENKHTYILENGKMDEKLKELESSTNEKRHLENKKLLFVNEYRSINKFRSQNFYKRSLSSNDINNLIPHNSKLINHICPIKNYYAIRVYLSDAIVEKVESLPNIKYCEKSIVLEEDSNSNSDKHDKKSENDSNDSFSNSDTYYDLEFIKKETNWTSVGIQEINKNSHSSKNYLLNYLPMISQSRYFEGNTKEFDYNYYYPGSGGKGIDIFLIDSGIDTRYDDFDTYEGTEHERVVMCDGIFNDTMILLSDTEEKKQFCEFNDYLHGHGVAAAAGGKYVGSAKYANIHMLATAYTEYDQLRALDHVKTNGQPHKTVINFSRHTGFDISHAFRDKFEELTKYGFIIVVSASNFKENACYVDRLFTGFNTTIKVAATNGISSKYEIFQIYNRADYSNYGACIDIYAPGQTLYPIENGNYEFYGNRYNTIEGTSFAAPLTAGVIATLMSEHPEIKYTYESMRKLLIDLSIKDILKDIQSDDTPNRFLNNGKRIVYSPVNVYKGCGASSGYSKCPEGSCCSSTNQCFEIGKQNILDQCLVERGCQTEYGTCLSDKKLTPREVTSTLYITLSPKTVSGTSTTTTTTTTKTTSGSKAKQLPTNISSSTTTTIQPSDIPEYLRTECGGSYGAKCNIVNPQNTAYIAIGCCSRRLTCTYNPDDCQISAGCKSRYGMCFMNTLTPTSSATADETDINSKIGQKCGKSYGDCIIRGEDGISYEHISCCSEKGYCGLSNDHCGRGCQSEFGACYAHHDVSITQSSSEITITVTTLPPTKSIESTETITITEDISTTTESIPITTGTHTKSTSITESTVITESTSIAENTKSTKYVTKTTTITIS